MAKSLFYFIVFSIVLFSLLIIIPQIDAGVNDQPDFRARGYSLSGELKSVFLNNGLFSGIGNEDDPIFVISSEPEGYYHGYQYLPIMSFILGIPGRDPQGNPYPWTMRPMVDSLGNVYPDSIVYWGATVSESWFDRTLQLELTDWEADSLGHNYLFGNATNQDIPENSGYHWIDPEDPFPVLAHSNYPFTWPSNGWLGFWGWDENGQITPGQFFSDEDIYWEMDDRTADRDVDPTQGYPTGIKVKAMASSFEEIPGGIVIIRYQLINQTQWDYKDIYTGFYFDADSYHRSGNGSYAGRTNEDDMMRVNVNQDLSFIWDLDDNSSGATGLAYVGIGYVKTPTASRDIDLNADGQPDIFTGQQTGVTGWHYFDWYFRPGARDVSEGGPFSGDGVTPVANDKENIQYKLMAGDTSSVDSDSSDHAHNRFHYFHPDLSGNLNPRFDSGTNIMVNYPDGLDCMFIISNGPFNLNSGDSTEVVVALLAADDSTGLVPELNTARSIFKHGIRNKDIHLVNGNGGEVFTGNATLTWYVDPGYPHSVDYVDIYLGKGYDPDWQLLASNLQNTGTYTFNATNFADGAFYRAAIVSNSGQGFVYGVSDTFFVINDLNGNVAPNLAIIQPMYKDTLSGTIPIQWVAADADFDPVYIDVEARQYVSWNLVEENLLNTGLYQMNTHQLLVGKADIRLTAKDNMGHSTSQIVEDLYIKNLENIVPDTVFNHLSGFGNGLMQLDLIDLNALNGHLYRLEFDSTDDHYGNLFDVDNGQYISQNFYYLDHLFEIQFDGLSLKMVGFDPVIIDSSYWKIGNSSWHIFVARSLGNPANYELVFSSMGVDTAYHPGNNQPVFPVPFQVFNRTYAPNSPLKLFGIDNQPLGEFSPQDKIYLSEDIIAGQPANPPKITFNMQFVWDSTSVPYQPGDIFRFTTIGYFWEQDTILFKSPTWLDIDNDESLIRQFALYQNYPNPFNPNTTIRFAIPYFTNVKIEIFNILGQKVRTLVNEKRAAGEYKILWDGRNDAGQLSASGIYFYRMKTADYIKSRKMIFIK